MPNLEIVRVGADEIEAARDKDGTGWVVVKKVCEVLGIDHRSQQKRLMDQPWATRAVMTLVAADGKEREQFCLSVDSTPMWLATIQTSRVSAKVKPKLVQFQKLAAKALADWAYGRPADKGDAVAQALLNLTKVIVDLNNNVMALKVNSVRLLPAKMDLDSKDLVTTPPRDIRKLLNKLVKRSTDHGFSPEFRSAWDRLYRLYGQESGIDLYQEARRESELRNREVKPLDLAEKYGHLVPLYRFAQVVLKPGAPREDPVEFSTNPTAGTTMITPEELDSMGNFESYWS